jgi:4-amino-4-deoxy-L-arabinose transferase-like glycosyltransferase
MRTRDRLQDPKFHFLILAVLSALLLFPDLHRGGLGGHDDAEFAHEGKQMLRSGDWWNIRYNGRLNFEYPPLFLWLEASSMKIFGASDFAAKFPTALAGFGTILLVFFLARELTGDVWLSASAMLVLLSTPFFIKQATHAMTDVPFTFFFALALYFSLRGLSKGQYLAFFGLAVALAILTRSVIGLAPLGIAVLYLTAVRRRDLLLSRSFALAFLLALLLPAVWYVSQLQLHGKDAFVSHLAFIQDKINSGATAWSWSSLLEYPKMLLKVDWPWLPFLLVGLWMAARAIVSRRDPAAILLILWISLLLLPFSFFETKYARYMTPAFPAFAILSAFPLSRLIPDKRRPAFFTGMELVGLAVIGVSLFLPVRDRAADMRRLAPLAESATPQGKPVLISTTAIPLYDFQNQFLWYSNSFSEFVPDLEQLALRLQREPGAVAILDRERLGDFSRRLAPDRRLTFLGESEKLVCLRVEGPP